MTPWPMLAGFLGVQPGCPAGPTGAPGPAGTGPVAPAGRDAQVRCRVTKKTRKKVTARCQAVFTSASASKIKWRLRSKASWLTVAPRASHQELAKCARLSQGRYALFVKGHGRAATFVVR